MPLPTPTLAQLEQRYWEAMGNGTGEAYAERLGDMRPRIFDYTQCAETTSNTFWIGTPYDELSRTYVAKVWLGLG